MMRPIALVQALVAAMAAAAACGGSASPASQRATTDHSHDASPSPASNSGARRSPAGPLGSAIAAAAPYARLVVPAGVYRESPIVIDKPITLIAASGATLDGAGAATVILVQADDVTVRGFMIRNTGASQLEERAGIKVTNGRHCMVSGNRIEQTLFGIYLERTSGCVVRDNVVRGSGGSQTTTGNGVHAWSSESLTVANNDVQGHRDGIYFEFVKDSRVTGNRSQASTRYGMHFMFSDDVSYEGNIFRDNGNGVAVMYSKRVIMRRNSFERSQGGASYGLLLKDINDSRLDSNRFVGNSTGLHLEGANRNRVTGNLFERNGLAVRLLANAQENQLEGNTFSGNAFDVSTNSRSGSSTLRGNYWDRYRGYDLDRDGVGDVAHLPVRLFSMVVEQSPAALVLLRSTFVELLDIAERVMPVLTPAAMRDDAPRMRPGGAP
jgi:nitrous oxidase accessory protein